MRLRVLTAAAVLLTAVPGLAVAAADVKVSIGAELAAQTEIVNQRDLDYLARELEEDVSRALASGPLRDAAVRLTIVAAKPNRPTQEQLRNSPGLSLESFGVGGAAIEGEVVLADGTRRAVDFDWYSANIADVGAATTWTDANRAFSQFARRLGQGRI